MIKLAEANLKTKFGIFKEYLFFDGSTQASALVKGDIFNKKNVITRIHSHCVSGHIFNGIECDCRIQMNFSQKIIQNGGKGLIIWLDQEGRGNGHLAKMLSTDFKLKGMSQGEAYLKAGYKEDSRDYSFAVKIIHFFNLLSIILITNHKRKYIFLKNNNIKINKVINTPIKYENYSISNELLFDEPL
ncbi:Riboflavin biosynthesis protein [subsurface metagenome]